MRSESQARLRTELKHLTKCRKRKQQRFSWYLRGTWEKPKDLTWVWRVSMARDVLLFDAGQGLAGDRGWSSLLNGTPERVKAPFLWTSLSNPLRPAIVESRCSRLQREFFIGGRLHRRLNNGERPIANKYCEGKMKRTLKKEWNSVWNCQNGKRNKYVVQRWRWFTCVPTVLKFCSPAYFLRIGWGCCFFSVGILCSDCFRPAPFPFLFLGLFSHQKGGWIGLSLVDNSFWFL